MTTADAAAPADPLSGDEAASGFAARVRTETQEAHDSAEHSAFMDDLLAGRLDAQAYTALLGQYLHLYRVLEAVESRFESAPELAAVLDPRLHRAAALEQDLAALTDGAPVTPPTPETAEYMARLSDLQPEEPERFFAHHYLRYLGDLSGGQVIGRLAVRHYGIPETALRTWRFEGIERLKPYKDAYRQALDSAPLSARQQDAFIAEASAGFTLARDLFEGLRQE
ncbi:heme oxygenase (biliverdin-producing) [Brevibacterium album]|uniref:biliverdin-producing heme oxygenase n=1 Tax=Brevibacterium album TaxID=417948 RepID=UPI0003FBFBB8|nr:biliverdin-producing heme oxygenase [Brevibacterium album]